MFADYAKEVADPKVHMVGACVRACRAGGRGKGGVLCVRAVMVDDAGTHPHNQAPPTPAQAKAETDLYLRQLETEGRAEEVRRGGGEAVRAAAGTLGSCEASQHAED